MRRPNIVIFQGEDTGLHQHCYGDAHARTPHIDQLAAEGCRFTNAFSTAPVCSPSRCTFVTGRYQTELGSHQHRSKLPEPPTVFTQVLRDAGYFVNWANKTDFNFEPAEAFADARTCWLDELESANAPDQPFCLYYNFGPTHESQLWPPDAEPGKEPPAAEPGYALDRHGGIPVPPYLPDTMETRSALARYYDRLELQDHFIGRVMTMLRLLELDADTIVIYMSDHGRGLPREKRWLYEAGIHMPLIVRWPGRIPAGQVREDLVSWVDLAPTILSLAGVDRSVARDRLHMPGRVFLDGQGQAPEHEPDAVFAARDRHDEAFDRARAARDRRYLYIRNDYPQWAYAHRNRYMETSPVLRQMRQMHANGRLSFPTDGYMAEQKPAEELYDTVVDPHCVMNLADEPALAETRQRLSAALDAWRDRYDRCGRMHERELIAQGIITDQLATDAARVEPLPEPLRHGGVYDTVHLPPET